MAEKAPKDMNGSTLRERAEWGKPDEKAPAVAELERRRSNLLGAVIPAWERAERGERYEDWEVVR